MAQGSEGSSTAGAVLSSGDRSTTDVVDDTAPPTLPVAEEVATDRTGLRVADALFAIILVATFVIYYVASRHVIVNGDDWLTAPRGNTFVDYFRPYEENLSVTPIAVYHFVFTVFGFGTYWPLRVAGIAGQMAVALTLWLIVRSRFGSAVALVVGVAVVWYSLTLLTPSLFNHWYALVGCLVAGWALTLRPGRSDWIVAGAITFALCSSGVGVAGAIGCLVYVALTKAPLRRWLAVGIPFALFVLWWFTLASGDHGQNTHLSFVDRLDYIGNGVVYSFQLIDSGGRWLGIALAIAFVVVVGWQIGGGIRAAAMEIAWSAAILAWWLGLSYTRAVAGPAGQPDVMRYRVVTFGFAVLALLPLARLRPLQRMIRDRRAVAVAIVAVVVLIAVNAPGIFDHVDSDADGYNQQAAKMVVLNLGPSVVADDAILRFDAYTWITVRHYRDLIKKYGEVDGTKTDHPDQAIVDLTDIRPVPTNAATTNCVPLLGPTKAPRTVTQRGVNPQAMVVLHAQGSDVTVQVRRFEQSWVTIGTIPANTTASFDLPVLMAQTPWMLQADGACVVQGS